MDHLNEYQVDHHPVYYIPNFINETEEVTLLRKIESSPVAKWRKLPGRRLQVWGGEISKSGTLVPQDLPSFVTDFLWIVCALGTPGPISPNLIEKLRSTGAFSNTSQGTANHIILNEYLPGQGITPHQDGLAYHPVVATLTLGSHTVMDYYRYQEPSAEVSGDSTTKMNEVDSGKVIDAVPILRLLLEPRSLVITHGVLYTQHLHGISGAHYDIFTSCEDINTFKSKHMGKEGGGQVVSVWDIANREILGSQNLRDRFAQLAGSVGDLDRRTEDDQVIRLERQTRASLTCRVVEKTSKAAGRLLKLR